MAAASADRLAPVFFGLLHRTIVHGLPEPVSGLMARGLPGSAIHPVASGLEGSVVGPIVRGLPGPVLDCIPPGLLGLWAVLIAFGLTEYHSLC